MAIIWLQQSNDECEVVDVVRGICDLHSDEGTLSPDRTQQIFINGDQIPDDSVKFREEQGVL